MNRRQVFYVCIIICLFFFIGIGTKVSAAGNTISIVNEEGSNKKPIISSQYFVWNNWQKDSITEFHNTTDKLEESSTDIYKIHEVYTSELSGIEDGDTVAKVFIGGQGWILFDNMSPVSSTELNKYLKLSPYGKVQINYPDIKEWNSQNIPTSISETSTPWTINSGEYIYGANLGAPYFAFVVNDSLLSGMDSRHIEAGLQLNLRGNQKASTTWDMRYSQEELPNLYHWQRVIMIFQFQPRVVKSSFRSINDPDTELTTQEIDGIDLTMDDPVSAKAKNIEGYIFDHYEYIDQYGVKKTSTDSSWIGKMDITKKGIVWWYKKEIPIPTIKKEADKTTVGLNEQIKYTIEASNTGNTELTNPIIMDVLPKASVSEPTRVTLTLNDETERALNKGAANANLQGEYYDYVDEQLIVHLGVVLETNEIKRISYTTSFISGENGDTKINTATLSGDNTTEKPSASVSVTINNGSMRLEVQNTVTFGEATLPKSIGTNLVRNPEFQVKVLDDRVNKNDFYVTAIESMPFTHTNKISTLTSPLIFKETNNSEQMISETDSALVYHPTVQDKPGLVNYESDWATKQGLMLKVPINAQIGSYTGEVTWNLNDAP